jgi:hypothetical protein
MMRWVVLMIVGAVLGIVVMPAVKSAISVETKSQTMGSAYAADETMPQKQ